MRVVDAETFVAKKIVSSLLGIERCEYTVDQLLAPNEAPPFVALVRTGDERQGREPVPKRQQYLRRTSLGVGLVRRDNPRRIGVLLIHAKRWPRQ